MAGFDVTSLFTNIPLDETIEIIARQLFCNSEIFHGFSLVEFVKLLNLAVKNCHFIFNGKFYDEVDGVAMGSPFGPLLANIFLSFHEINGSKIVLYILNHCTIVVMLTILVVFRSRDHIIPFLVLNI